MYSGAWKTLHDCAFVDWPEFAGETSITALARRIILEHNILPQSIVAGSSLGGIVACEIANQLPLAGLILIGSARNKAEINPLLSILHPLIDLAPLSFIQMSTGKIPGELMQMFHQCDPRFIRAMTRAIFEWPGLQVDHPKPLRIHGKYDRVIAPPSDVSHLLEGGHLIAMTHAAECIGVITAYIDSVR